MNSKTRACVAAVLVGALSAAVSGAAIPDLTKGEGPDIARLDNGTYSSETWVLHYHGLRGWMYKDAQGNTEMARQILISQVQEESRIAGQVLLGDVILGVGGKLFTTRAVFAFRKAARAARESETPLSVIMRRKEWGESRNVTLTPTPLETDFTKGAKPDFDKGVDWNLGATGARGWVHAKFHDTFPSRQIYITKVHEGSPADGVLREGDVILGIGGKPFSSDARKAFGRALTRAETREGKGQLALTRWRGGDTSEVTLHIDVLGSYSATTPWECDKSRRIVDRACDYLVRNGVTHGITTGPAVVRSLALMSTGNKRYMPVVREHAHALVELFDRNMAARKDLPSWGYPSWGWGYINLFLTEYHLLTGDKKVLPAITKYSNSIAEGQSGVGSWGHGMAWPHEPMNRGRRHGALGGYGALNQAGTICWISLMLAKRCGVTSPEIEQAIVKGHRYLETFVDLQTIPYGDNLNVDVSHHDDNGKNSAAAVGFALFGDKHGTDYYGRMTVASHAVREGGHTGNWFAFIWAAPGAARSGQDACSAFLHELTWLFDMERQWDGGFSYQGKPGFGAKLHTDGPRKGMQRNNAEHQYPHWDTTGSRILMYCLPRKALCITGKDLLTVDIPPDEVGEVIEAGRVPGSLHVVSQKYDGKTEAELLELLGSWSPVVRGYAAGSLAKGSSVPVGELLKMLESPKRYTRYGAATALRRLKLKRDSVIDALIRQLDSDDLLMRMHATLALGFTGDRKAVEPLLRLAARDFPEDKRGTTVRVLCVALFQTSPYKDDKGLLADSIEGIDDSLLIPALKKLIYCKAGGERSMLGRPILMLSKAQRDQLWPELIFAIKEVAPSGIMGASGIRLTIASLLSDNKIEEGIDLLVEYLKYQKGHGFAERTEKIFPMFKLYGARAKRVLPQLEAYLKKVESGRNPSRDLIEVIRETIDAIKASTERVETISIKDYLK
jgi:hypothetical protein